MCLKFIFLSMLFVSTPVVHGKSGLKGLVYRIGVSRVLGSMAAATLLSCANIACERVSQPLFTEFTGGGTPSVGPNIDFFNSSQRTAMSFYSPIVTLTDDRGVVSDEDIVLNLHDRTTTVGDFRLSIDGGPYSNTIYGWFGPTDSTIYDSPGTAGNVVGTIGRQAGYLQAIIDLETNLRLEVDFREPQTDTSSDQINRVIRITISDQRSDPARTLVYETSSEWIHSLTTTALISPEILLLPSYRQLYSGLGANDFVSLFASLDYAGQRAIHDSLSNRIYKSENGSGRMVWGRDTFFDVQYQETYYDSVGFRLEENDGQSSLTISKGSAERREGDLRINGVTRKSYHQGNTYQLDWELRVSELSSQLHRVMDLEVSSVTLGRDGILRNVSLVDGAIEFGNRFVFDNVNLDFDLTASLSASGW